MSEPGRANTVAPWGRGRVTLIGAGPGSPDLIAVRGLRRLRRAQVVLFDRLVHRDLLDEAPRTAERIDSGKRAGHKSVEQGWIERLMIDRARRGLEVVRLKGGDPYLFGRGSEEATACHRAGIRCEVIPGISSALAAPACAGVPVTERGVAASVAIVTGQRARQYSAIDWQGLAGADTLVILMGLGPLAAISQSIIAAGRSPDTPAAVIERASLADQRVVYGTLADVAERAHLAGLRSPATTVVGSVVDRRLSHSAVVATADAAEWAARYRSVEPGAPAPDRTVPAQQR